MIKLKLIAFLLCISAIMSAQLQFGFGIKGGAEANINKLEPENIGYCYGGFVNLGYGKHFSIKPELLLFTMNHAGLENITDEDAEPTKLTYRSIPFLLQIKLGRGFSLEGGPQFNTATGDNLNTYKGPQNYMNWALGFNFHMGKNVHLTFRYMGLGTEPYYKSTSGTEYTNESVMVGLGISLFNLKERTFKKQRSSL